MFETLFTHPRVLRRHREGPLAEERAAYRAPRHSRPPPSRRRRHQHDPRVVGACVPRDNESLRRGRSGDEGQSPANVRR